MKIDNSHIGRKFRSKCWRATTPPVTITAVGESRFLAKNVEGEGSYPLGHVDWELVPEEPKRETVEVWTRCTLCLRSEKVPNEKLPSERIVDILKREPPMEPYRSLSGSYIAAIIQYLDEQAKEQKEKP